MVVGVIQASSQSGKNALLFECVKEAAEKYGHEAVNFGAYAGEPESWSYVETAVSAGLLLASGAVDFIVTGCSSGQGMMLAMNSLPGVLCGYVPTPQDAYLFGRINGGNAASLPLGLGFGWCGEINLRLTLDKLFDGPLGAGYPPEDAERKQRDAALVKQIRAQSLRDWPELIDRLDAELLSRALKRESVARYIVEYGKNRGLVDRLGI